MALIPADVGIRMRMQTEANLLQPVAPAHEIPSDLPDLVPGRVFTARIQDALPDNTFRALVAGKTITLSLPEGAKPGDQMELVIVERSTKSIIAKQVQAEPGAGQTGGAAAYPFTRLSAAAQLIGQLLPAAGEAPPAVQLNRGQPLLPTPPASQATAAELAPTLAKAVTQSGLFYEAHQAQWVSGKLPLTQLLQEPQGQRSSPAAFQLAASEATTHPLQLLPQSAAQISAQSNAPLNTPLSAQLPASLTASLPNSLNDSLATLVSAENDQADSAAGEGQASRTLATDGNQRPAQPTTSTLLQTLLGNGEKVGAGETAQNAGSSAQTSLLSSRQMPEELRPIVQQQLEAVATQRVFWHGEVWPQQSIDWEIEWQSEGEGHANPEEDAVWRTALSLTTPRLGRVDASLQLTTGGVLIVIAAADDASATDLRNASRALADALTTAGVPLLAFQVKQVNEYPAIAES